MSSKASGADFVPGGWTWPEDIPVDEPAAEPENPLDNANSQAAPTPPQPEPVYHAYTGSDRHWRPRTCRICLEQVLPTFNPPNENLPEFLAGRPYVSYESESGHLIRPCLCKGSSRYVHEQCLQQWRHSDRSYTSQRHYFNCPTCSYSYKLHRLTWARYISSTGMCYSTQIFVRH